jgi:tRNA pseudouridine55 synthase
MAEIIDKLIGETPLEALERFRAGKIDVGEVVPNDFEWSTVPMTYAGRLDPMAEGKLLILIGDECKDKEKYLGLDKEYEVEIVFELETDTYDALGLVVEGRPMQHVQVRPRQNVTQKWLQKYVGKFVQPYPPYSSKTVNGKQLHELARSGELPELMPTKKVEIHSIDLICSARIECVDLLARIKRTVDLVKGDFRQKEIKNRWGEFLTKFSSNFRIIKIQVNCSSGTYMRSLAHTMGIDRGVGAFALSINRTKIGPIV